MGHGGRWGLARSTGGYLVAPVIFTANFFLLLRREIVLDFKSVANSLGGGALFDIICDCLARQVQQILDVQKIRCENNVEQDFILHTNELAVKCVLFIVRSHGNIKFVMLLQIVEHLLQDVGLAAGKKVNSEKKGGRGPALATIATQNNNGCKIKITCGRQGESAHRCRGWSRSFGE